MQIHYDRARKELPEIAGMIAQCIATGGHTVAVTTEELKASLELYSRYHHAPNPRHLSPRGYLSARLVGRVETTTTLNR